MSKGELVKIEEVCEILDSMRVPVTTSDRKTGIYPYYGANGIQDYVSDYIFDDELVLLAEDGGNFGSKTKPIAYRVSGKCWVNNHAHVLKAKPTIDIDYLCYSIMFYDVSKIISGTTRAKLNQAAMRKMTILLPAMETQKQIAKTLDTTAELLAMRKQQLAELDNLIKSIFYDMFGNTATNEKGWKIRKIMNIAKVETGSTPSRNNMNYYDEGLVPWVKTGEISNGYIFCAEEKISGTAIKETNCKLFPCNTILVAMYGQGKTRGQAGMLKIEAATNQACAAILPNEQYISEFLYRMLEIKYEDLRELGRGGNQQNLNLSIVKNFEIMTPSLSLQTKFAEIVAKIEEQKALVKKAIHETQYLFDSLMSKYFDELK